MASRVLIIDGKEPNAGVGGVSAADFSHFSNRFLTPGIIESGDYLVEAQATPDMSVKYAAGKAYVEDTTGTFNIPVEDDTGGNVTIEPNVSGNDRIDTIVIAIDTVSAPNENADNIIEVRALEGTPAASPSALTDNEIQTALGAGYAWLKLAEVTVENGATSITGADVSDIRTEVGVQTGGIVLDEDDMASDSATRVPTQQSVKAYVDANSGSSDGWTEAGETLAYASATTFTVSGDRTTKYQKGTRIKLTQTSVKYFVVINSVHSGGTTTVTITGGTDYTLANAAITSPYYSYQASPQGYPTWFAYTPSWTGTIGNGALTGKFAVTGKMAHFQAKIAVGSTTSFGPGVNLLGLPLTSSPTHVLAMFTGNALDAAIAHYAWLGLVANSANTMDMYRVATGSLSAAPVSGTAPFTIGSGDSFSISGFYEI